MKNALIVPHLDCVSPFDPCEVIGNRNLVSGIGVVVIPPYRGSVAAPSINENAYLSRRDTGIRDYVRPPSSASLVFRLPPRVSDPR